MTSSASLLLRKQPAIDAQSNYVGSCLSETTTTVLLPEPSPTDSVNADALVCINLTVVFRRDPASMTQELDPAPARSGIYAT
jgi:hypothetical protein